ncbi:hypothetical protein J1614_001434 [Plenodomus biglobosus]|nr:hypothetical protein J1614_001434 [Plenodomus biglobosus]
MLKRTAKSPLSKDEPSKRQKVTSGPGSPNAPAVTSPAPGASSPTSTSSPLTEVPNTPEGPALPEEIATKKPNLKKRPPKKQTTPKKQAAPKQSTTGAPPVAETFEAWIPPQPDIPEPSPYWGIKPIMRRVNEGDEDSPLVPDPLPHPDQPAARTSNGATNPPMWEDLGARFQRGSRYVKYTSTTAPDNADNLPQTIDQEDLLQIKLIDMRPKSAKDRTPRRVPVTYHYGDDQKDGNGARGRLGRKPKDWANKQAVKCINDRRAQAIGRITMDNAWTPQEREYLTALFAEFPNASIWEIAARHNTRFVGDFVGATGGLNGSYLSTGRTVESVRNQYLMHKPAYDRGEAPSGVRPSSDNCLESKEAARKWKKDGVGKSGSPDKKLEEAYDAGKDALEAVRKEGEENELVEGQEKQTMDEEKRGEEAHERFVKEHGDELIEFAGYTEWYSENEPPVRTPSQFPIPPARDAPQPATAKQVVVVDEEVHTERSVVEETVVEDVTFEQVTTQTVVEGVTEVLESATAGPPSAPKRKRTASEVYQEKMKGISEDYDDDDDAEEEKDEEL